jgi:hypothetical protein
MEFEPNTYLIYEPENLSKAEKLSMEAEWKRNESGKVDKLDIP